MISNAGNHVTLVFMVQKTMSVRPQTLLGMSNKKSRSKIDLGSKVYNNTKSLAQTIKKKPHSLTDSAFHATSCSRSKMF